MSHAQAIGLEVIALGNLALVTYQGQLVLLVAFATMGFGLGLASVAASNIGTEAGGAKPACG
jgi:hypothetical protein